MNTPKPRPAQGQSHPISIIRDLRHATMGANEKAILYALASRMQDCSSATWPSVGTIAGDAGVSESTVHNVLPWLKVIGVLVSVQSDKPTNAYTINFDRLTSLPDDLPARTSGVRRSGKGAPGVPPTPRAPSTGRSHGGAPGTGEGVRPVESRGAPRAPEGKEKTKVKTNSEDKAESRATHAPPSLPSPSAPPSPSDPTGLSINTATLTPEAERALSTIVTSPELVAAASRGSTPEQLASNIASAVPGKDPTKKLQGLAKWLHDRPQVTPGAKWLLDKIVSDADKLPRLEAPKPPPPQPAFVPEPPTRPRPVPLPDEATFIEQQLAGDLRRFTPATLAQLHQVVVEDRARSFEKYGPTTNPIALQVLAWKPPTTIGASN